MEVLLCTNTEITKGPNKFTNSERNEKNPEILSSNKLRND